MQRLGIQTGADLRTKSLAFLQQHIREIRRLVSRNRERPRRASVRSLASREAFAHRLQREWKSKIKRAELY
jgi:hypothetical protein